MADWELSICGLEALARHCRHGVSHVVSILDPEEPEPESLAAWPAGARLMLRFHDIVGPSRWLAAPKAGHVELLLAFGRSLRGQAGHLLIHCHGGVSRSTAAAAALLLQAHPEADEDEVIGHVAGLRPQAWPNARIVTFADHILNRQGRLIEALGRFYGKRLSATPGLARRLHENGRSEEVEMAIYPDNARSGFVRRYADGRIADAA